MIVHRALHLSLPGLALLLGLVVIHAPLRADTPGKIDFAHDIVPLIKARCGECHTNGQRKGSLSLDTREEILRKKVVVVGQSAASELIRRVSSADPDYRMPPKGAALTSREVKLLQTWIDAGLPWEEGFTFRVNRYVAPLLPRRPPIPPARPGLEHPIDRILAAYFDQHHTARPARLDDDAFLRRASLDLIGLLPTCEQRRHFLEDHSSDKRARFLQQLLEDPRLYADHWLSFWNDLLRNDYQGTGYIDGGRTQITGWLYRSLLENKPYDQFVRELISPRPEAEGFIKGIKWRGKVNASQATELQFAQSISQVFFGVNLKCASCHDSFIDNWKLNDAYSLAAITASGPLEIYRCDKETGKKASPRFLWPELGTISASQPRAERLATLAQLVTEPRNGRFARTIVNRLWQRLFGRGIVHPVDMMAHQPWSEDLLDHLATYLTDHHYDLKQVLQYVMTSQAYQSQAAAWKEEGPAESYGYRGPEVKRMTAEQFIDSLWMLTGTAPTKIVAPIQPPPFKPTTPPEQRFVRAALVTADALMRSLGRPNREQVVTTRPDQLTTLEALDLSNGQIITQLLQQGAEQLLTKHRGLDAEGYLRLVYEAALGREPTAQERTAGRTALGTPITPDALADLLWTVVMLPEFQLIR